MGSPAEELVAALAAQDATLATAESLTGGQAAAAVTAVPGSSEVFAGGVVSYQTRVKVSVLGVAQETVDRHGVVSAECAEEMALGVRKLLDTAYGVSTTGVAGPETQEGKAVGTVFVGVAGPHQVRVLALDLAGDRPTIQQASVDAALSALAGMVVTDAKARSVTRGTLEDSGLR